MGSSFLKLIIKHHRHCLKKFWFFWAPPGWDHPSSWLPELSLGHGETGRTVSNFLWKNLQKFPRNSFIWSSKKTRSVEIRIQTKNRFTSGKASENHHRYEQWLFPKSKVARCSEYNDHGRCRTVSQWVFFTTRTWCLTEAEFMVDIYIYISYIYISYRYIYISYIYIYVWGGEIKPAKKPVHHLLIPTMESMMHHKLQVNTPTFWNDNLSIPCETIPKIIICSLPLFLRLPAWRILHAHELVNMLIVRIDFVNKSPCCGFSHLPSGKLT